MFEGKPTNIQPGTGPRRKVPWQARGGIQPDPGIGPMLAAWKNTHCVTAQRAAASRARDLQPQVLNVEMRDGRAVFRLGERIVMDRAELAALLRALPKEGGLFVRVSDAAIKQARDYITAQFDKRYLPEEPNVYKGGRGSKVQDAHEAIRPTEVGLRPEDLKKYLERDLFKLYQLIWRRFVASQMNPAVFEATKVDFDLANFAILGGMVMPALARGDDSTIGNPGRHEIEDYKGTVANLTPTSFRLIADVGAPFQVNYDANTPVYKSSNGAPTTLANGQRVEVRGFFVSGVLTAVSIKVKDEPGGGAGEVEARGGNTNINLGAKTYVLANIQGVQGFMPQGSTVNVVWTDSTVFRRSGVQVSADQLLNWPFSEVKGSYNASTNTITATRITLENNLNGEQGGEAEAKGDISQVDLNANTMVLLNSRDIEGFTPQGSTVNVTWTSETVFRRSGNTVTENALLQWPIAKVKGLYVSATNTIQASRITLDDD